MAENLISFSWYKNKDGYRIAKGRGKDDALYICEATFTNRRYKEYLPLQDYPHLYREFAKIDAGNIEAVLGFVNLYGVPENRRALGAPGCLYPLASFQAEVTAMRETVELHNLARGLLDPAVIEKHAMRDSPDSAAVRQRLETLARWEFPLEAIYLVIEKPRPVDMAYSRVKNLVNEHIAPHVSPRLIYSQDGEKITDMYFRVVPSSLLGAMWLQMAQAVDSGKHVLSCDVCGRWFEEREQIGKRPAKAHCSKACKQKAYRAGDTYKARKARA